MPDPSSSAAPKAGQESVFAGVAAISADAVITIDDSHRITFFNRGAEEIFGWSAAEVIGQPLDVLLPERFRGMHGRHVEEFGRSTVDARRMGERRAISGLRRNGEEFPAEASIAKVEIGGRQVFSVVLRDFTAQLRAEQMQRLLAEAGAVLASSLDPGQSLRQVARLAVQRFSDWCVFYLEDAGRLIRFAAEHADAAGQELLARLQRLPLRPTGTHPAVTVMDTGEPELIEEFPAALIAAMAAGEEELTLLRALEPRSAAFAPMLGRDRVLGALALVSSRPGRRYGADELRLAEELARRAAFALDNARLYHAARDAVQARDEVLSVVSHDLGNPLSAIFVATRLLRRATGPRPPAGAEPDAVEMIRASAEQLQRLIDDLLEVQRLEANRLRLQIVDVTPASLVEAAVVRLRPLAEERGVTLIGDPRGALPLVRADAERIHQVFSNLIGNALRFTPAGGRVVVAAEKREGDVIFSVTDDGEGIAPDDLPHVFDRFWQARHSGSHGVGLGLSIAKGIVEAHSGRIRVESRPGEGSTFLFTLPALL